MLLPFTALRRARIACLLVWFSLTGCSGSQAQKPVSGIRLATESTQADFDIIVKQYEQAPIGSMKGPGLVGLRGGLRLKAFKTGSHELLLPIPQQVDSQTPIVFGIHSPSHPKQTEYRLRKRDETNDVLAISIEAERGAIVTFEWVAVVLIGERMVPLSGSLPEAYDQPTACVQADSAAIKELAEKLWPTGGSVEKYAGRIQQFVRSSQPSKPPRSLDALGILTSGNNQICTANANLAVALLRARGIPARSLAVVPPNSQRLEMHRIVEFELDERRYYFDPSGLHAEIPLQAWQTVIMSKTSVDDENAAMQPRMGVSLGCPYGQEAEFTEGNLTFDGPEFFWTEARPMAEFEPGELAMTLANAGWKEFLQTGLLTTGQRAAIKATSQKELLELLQAK